MIWLPKFLHLIGLMLGAGAAFGSMAVVRAVRGAAGTPSPQLLALRPVFARMALGGIAVLWISGLWLYLGFYRGADLGGAFHAKLATATLLLLIVAAISIVGARAKAAGAPPPAWLPRLGMVTPVLLILAVGLAVYVFR